MIDKLLGVDRLHLHFDYHSESNSVFYQLFVQNEIYFFFLMKLTHIQVFKKECMKLDFFCNYLQADTLLFLFMFCMFRYSNNKIYKWIPK